jgi:hypothetical protein
MPLLRQCNNKHHSATAPQPQPMLLLLPLLVVLCPSIAAATATATAAAAAAARTSCCTRATKLGSRYCPKKSLGMDLTAYLHSSWTETHHLLPSHMQWPYGVRRVYS